MRTRTGVSAPHGGMCRDPSLGVLREQKDSTSSGMTALFFICRRCAGQRRPGVIRPEL